VKSDDPIWEIIRAEAAKASVEESRLSDFFQSAILDQTDLNAVINASLCRQMCIQVVSQQEIAEIIKVALDSDPAIGHSMRLDIMATVERDPACANYLAPILYFKGFQALQLHRISRWLWLQGRNMLALFFQHQISEVFSVDIHPAATMGAGIMLDHATGLVIGETAVVGDNVSILHSVTLGGSGCTTGDRHPKIGNDVMIAAGAKVLGNISIGDGVKIGAGSLVLESVPAHVTVAGVPAKIIGTPSRKNPALEMDQYFI
jgi:serine O-acetyltransferase